MLFGTTKHLEPSEASFIVCPTLYFMAFLSSIGIQEIKSAIPHQDVDEKEDSACRSLVLQLRLLGHFSRANCIYNVAYAGFIVSEMGYLLSFVYINAWTSQFFHGQDDGLE